MMQVSRSFGNTNTLEPPERRDIPLECVNNVFSNYPVRLPVYVTGKCLEGPSAVPIPNIDTSCIHNLYALAFLFSGTSAIKKIQNILSIVLPLKVEFVMDGRVIKISFCNRLIPATIQSLAQFRGSNEENIKEHIFKACQSGENVALKVIKDIFHQTILPCDETESEQQYLVKTLLTYGYYFNKSCFKSFVRTLQQNRSNVADGEHYVYYVSLKFKDTFLHAFVVEQIPGEKSAKYRIYQTSVDCLTGKEWLKSTGYLDVKPYMSEREFTIFLKNLNILICSTHWDIESEFAHLACFGTHNPHLTLAGNNNVYSYDPKNREFNGLCFQFLVDSFSPEDVQRNLDNIIQEMFLHSIRCFRGES